MALSDYTWEFTNCGLTPGTRYRLFVYVIGADYWDVAVDPDAVPRHFSKGGYQWNPLSLTDLCGILSQNAAFLYLDGNSPTHRLHFLCAHRGFW